MVFKLAKVIDEGVGNPLVARLGLQTADLLKWLDTSEETRGEIAKLYIFNLCEKIVYCERIVKNLESIRNSEAEKIQKNAQSSPFIPSLEPISHDFLYQTKNFVRDTLGVIHILYGKRFKEASDLVNMRGSGPSTVERWAASHFGSDHTFTIMLARDAEWVAEPIKMRNAVEHPGGLSGTLEVGNLQRQTILGGQIIGPFWRRGDGRFNDMISDMKIILSNMLTFAEELIVGAVGIAPTHESVQIYEIPKDERDPAMPVRFKIGLKKEVQDMIDKSIRESR